MLAGICANKGYQNKLENTFIEQIVAGDLADELQS